jgi:YbbR domain-containing protein
MSFIQYLLLFFGFTLFLYLNNYNFIYSHIHTNNQIAIEEILDQSNKIKVQFAYDQEKVKINTLIDLKFSVLNSTTGEHIKNFLARVVIT